MHYSARSWESEVIALGFGLLIGIAVLQPGVLPGAVVTVGWWRWAQPSLRLKGAVALASIAAAVFAIASVTWAWPWRLALTVLGVAWVPPTWVIPNDAAPAMLLSIGAEALAGPAWATGFLLIRWTHEGMPSGMIDRERRHQESRRRRMGLSAPDTQPSVDVGAVRLGVDTHSRKRVPLVVPADLAQHVTIIGKIGSGKTTTAARIVEAAVAARWPVVIVDAKGFGSLRSVATRFAANAGIPFALVAPDDPASLRYNPCTGTPSQISNKLVGAFSFGAEAEIYKNIAQEVLPVLIRALRAAGRQVTLRALFQGLAPEGMIGLTRALSDDDDALRAHLRDLADRRSPYPAGYAGMRSRLGALLEGMYGQLFTLAPDGTTPVLDLAASLRSPSITYISLPAMEAAEDVELMARVLAQDIKQVAAARLASGHVDHSLLVLDEFAGLREATQLNDLLLQAREARICCVVCTQFLPSAVDAPSLRHALLSAGMFISHQCSSDDADAIAGLFGTRRTVEVTHQVDYALGTSEKGSMKHVDEYRVHPNELRDLPRGHAAVRIEPGTRRIATVRIDRPLEMGVLP
jgi:hypothetical protein